MTLAVSQYVQLKLHNCSGEIALFILTRHTFSRCSCVGLSSGTAAARDTFHGVMAATVMIKRTGNCKIDTTARAVRRGKSGGGSSRGTMSYRLVQRGAR